MDQYLRNPSGPGTIFERTGKLAERLCVTNYQQILASIEPIRAVEVDLEPGEYSGIQSFMSSFLLHLKPSSSSSSSSSSSKDHLLKTNGDVNNGDDGNCASGYLRFDLDEKKGNCYHSTNWYSSLQMSVSSDALAKQLLLGSDAAPPPVTPPMQQPSSELLSNDLRNNNDDNNIGLCKLIQLVKYEAVLQTPKIVNAATVLENLAHLVFADLRFDGTRSLQGTDVLRFLYFVAKRLAVRQSTNNINCEESREESTWEKDQRQYKLFVQTLNPLDAKYWHW